MQLENRFTIPVEAGRAWDVLLDVRQVIPCFPGASVTAVEDDTIDGSVRIKLGPVLLHYAGTATFVEKDAAARRVVLSARGSDRKGGGSAAATITAGLRAVDDDSTECVIVTDLDITGRPAQFGRGIMTEVGNRITEQFAANLSTMLTSPNGRDPHDADAADVADGHGPGAMGQAARFAHDESGRDSHGADALDLLHFARGAAVKRMAPVIGALAAVILVVALRRHASTTATRRLAACRCAK